MDLDYVRDPADIYAKSFQIIRNEACDDLVSLPGDMEPLVVRLMHAVGMTDLVSDLRFSAGAIKAGISAIRSGKPILADVQMVAGGITRRFLSPDAGGFDNDVIVTLNNTSVAELAASLKTTRSAAALELWRPHLSGSVVAIGNAPTALFRLLEMIREGADKPALILGFPVGFVGAAESKLALVDAAAELDLDYICLLGRRGGTPLASAAVNALAIAALGATDQPASCQLWGDLMADDAIHRWLSIIGIGEGGADELSDLAWSLIADAEYLVGGKRHLAMIPDDLSPVANRIAWPSPFSEVFAQLKRLRGQKVVVLASGDPMHFGIGGTLTHHFNWNETRVLPSPSSLSHAAGQLGWPLDKIAVVTIHGRDPATLIPHLLPGARLLILSKDGNSPALVAELLCKRGLETASLTVLEHLGGPDEQIIETSALAITQSENETRFADLNLMALSLPESFSAWLPTIPGLPDDAFEHDGKMTKRDIRASALAKLAPYPGALLWDVGTGCGSIAIEWLRTHPQCRAVGIEPLEKRRAFAKHNAKMLGVPRLRLLAGKAPDDLRGEDAPDAVFVGGGLSHDVINFCLRQLKDNGRLVAHAVTLGSEQLLLDMYQRHGGELTRLSISKASPVGPLQGWKAAMPVTQWVFIKTQE